MNLRGTAILAVVVGGTAAYVWMEGVPTVEPEQTRTLLGEPLLASQTQAIQHFFDLHPADVVMLRLSKGEDTYTATRRGNTWQGVAKPEVVDDFIYNLNSLGVVMEISEEPVGLRDYGLEPARSVVELRRREAEPLFLQIGDHNPATTGVYVRIGTAGPVALAGALLVWEFDKAFRALEAGRTPIADRE
jgi:hypothetical protein